MRVLTRAPQLLDRDRVRAAGGRRRGRKRLGELRGPLGGHGPRALRARARARGRAGVHEARRGGRADDVRGGRRGERRQRGVDQGVEPVGQLRGYLAGDGSVRCALILSAEAREQRRGRWNRNVSGHLTCPLPRIAVTGSTS